MLIYKILKFLVLWNARKSISLLLHTFSDLRICLMCTYLHITVLTALFPHT